MLSNTLSLDEEEAVQAELKQLQEEAVRPTSHLTIYFKLRTSFVAEHQGADQTSGVAQCSTRRACCTRRGKERRGPRRRVKNEGCACRLGVCVLYTFHCWLSALCTYTHYITFPSAYHDRWMIK